MSRGEDEFECDHTRAGIVTTHPDLNTLRPSDAHAAVTVCGDTGCRAAALAWVQRAAGRPGYYVSDRRREANA